MDRLLSRGTMLKINLSQNYHLAHSQNNTDNLLTKTVSFCLS